jgi:hypothetical protein
MRQVVRGVLGVHRLACCEGRSKKRLTGGLGGLRYRITYIAARLGKLPRELEHMSFDELAELDAVIVDMDERDDDRVRVMLEGMAKMFGAK